MEEQRQQKEREEARRRQEEEEEERRVALEREMLERRYELDTLKERQKVRTHRGKRWTILHLSKFLHSIAELFCANLCPPRSSRGIRPSSQTEVTLMRDVRRFWRTAVSIELLQ